MRWLLFFSRVAFVCNLLFLVSFSLLLYNWIGQEEITSALIIVGYVLAVVFNPAVNLVYLVLFWVKKNSLAAIPAWLIVMNILFLMLQLLYLLLLNVTNY
jgi:hypothetical protein